VGDLEDPHPSPSVDLIQLGPSTRAGEQVLQICRILASHWGSLAGVPVERALRA
jgi:hypothetical protein